MSSWCYLPVFRSSWHIVLKFQNSENVPCGNCCFICFSSNVWCNIFSPLVEFSSKLQTPFEAGRLLQFSTLLAYLSYKAIRLFIHSWWFDSWARHTPWPGPHMVYSCLITEYGSHGQIIGPKLCFACKHPGKCTILELVVCFYCMITCAVYFVHDLERTVTQL